MGVVYFLLLPKSNAFITTGTVEYRTISTSEEHPLEDDILGDVASIAQSAYNEPASVATARFSIRQKVELAKPLFLPFMLPLFVVYFAEVFVRPQYGRANNTDLQSVHRQHRCLTHSSIPLAFQGSTSYSGFHHS